MGELVDLESKRKERWIRTIEHMREIGGVAVFGTVGEVDATILPFRRRHETPEETEQQSLET